MSKFPETAVTMIERMQNGEFADLEAWSRSLQRYYVPAERYVCHLCEWKSPEEHPECHDIVQKAIAKMWEIIQKGSFNRQRTGSFRAYFKTCIRSAKGDYFRAEDRIREELIINKPVEGSDDHVEVGMLIPDPNQDPDYVTEEEKQQLSMSFLDDSMKRIVRRSHLSEAHRLIIQLVADGEKSEVVAKKCNTTSDNVRHVMSRYVKAVRKELEELAAEDVLLTLSSSVELGKSAF